MLEIIGHRFQQLFWSVVQIVLFTSSFKHIQQINLVYTEFQISIFIQSSYSLEEYFPLIALPLLLQICQNLFVEFFKPFAFFHLILHNEIWNTIFNFGDENIFQTLVKFDSSVCLELQVFAVIGYYLLKHLDDLAKISLYDRKFNLYRIIF